MLSQCIAAIVDRPFLKRGACAYRYMLGADDHSLYVVFMGTKHARDLLSDANFLQEAVWKPKAADKQQQVISISLCSAFVPAKQ